MVKYINNPPDALSLTTSARSFGNYDLAGALAGRSHLDGRRKEVSNPVQSSTDIDLVLIVVSLQREMFDVNSRYAVRSKQTFKLIDA